MITKPILLDETGKRVADSLDKLIDKLGTHKITVLARSDDGGEITDQVIKVIEVATGNIYGEFVVSSVNSVTFEVPNYFSYQIVPIDTMSGYYCTDKPSGIANQDSIITLTWKTLGSISTIVDLKAVVDKGLAKYIKTGRGDGLHQEVTLHHERLGDIVFDCVNYNAEEESITLLMKNTLSANKMVDNVEGLYKATSGLSAGAYTFKNGNTSYYFTLTKDLVAGGVLRATTSQFFTYTDNYQTSYDESGSVSTTVIEGATDLGVCASGLLNHMDRVNSGSNDYGESAIRQWLNGKENWWTAKTMFDLPPNYVNELGFMSGIDDETLNAIDVTEVKCYATSAYSAPDSTHVENTKYTVNDKFFLPSEMEIFGSATFDDGSKQYDYYLGSVNVDRIKYYGTSARYWWLRSPHSSANNVRNVNTSGAVLNYNANYGYVSVAVACKISKSN